MRAQAQITFPNLSYYSQEAYPPQLVLTANESKKPTNFESTDKKAKHNPKILHIEIDPKKEYPN